jgi:ferritin
LTDRMAQELNGQVNAELYSAYLYLSMSAYLEAGGRPGFARWMRAQVVEELTHAGKLYDYVVRQGARVVMAAINAPPGEWDSVPAVARAVLAHERKVTGLIKRLVDVAEEEQDDGTAAFLQWFVREQNEEEESAQELIEQIDGAGVSGLEALDRELGERRPKYPA